MTYKEIAIETLKSTKVLMTSNEIVDWAVKNLKGIKEKFESVQTQINPYHL